MKKWIGIFLAVSAVVFLIVRSVTGEAISKDADFGIICEEGEYISQIAQCDGKNYVIYKTHEQQNARVVNVDKNLYQYEAIGTVHPNQVYYLYSYIDENQLKIGAEPIFLSENEFWESPVFETEGTLLAAGSMEDEILVSILGEDKITVTEYALPLYYEDYYEWEERMSFSLTEEHYIVGAIYEEGELFLIQEDGTVYYEDIEIEEAGMTAEDITFSNCFKKQMISGAKAHWLAACKNAAAKENILLVFMISLFLVFGIYGIKKENHMIYRLICCTEIICIFFLGILGQRLEKNLIQQKMLECGMEAGSILEEIKLKQLADGTVEALAYQEAMEERQDFLEDLIIMHPESGEVLLSKTLPAGENLYDSYGAECKVLAERTAQENQAVMMFLEQSGRNEYIVSTRNWTEIEAQTILLAVMSKSGIEKNVGKFVSDMWNSFYLVMMFITIGNMLLFLLFSYRYKRFLLGMEQVAKQKAAMERVPKKNDGFYGAWSVLDKISENMLKLRYERDTLYERYDRFMPRGVEQLLKKADISEVEAGDKRKLQGCVLHFHLEKGSQDAFVPMEMIMESMKNMNKVLERYQGVVLSSDAGLLSRKLFFENSATEALQFAIDLFYAESSKNAGWKLKNTLLLHYGEFDYGIAGSKNQLVPFFYEEEQILEKYKKSLAKANVKIAITEQALKALGKDSSVRYLGFIFNDSGNEKINLYECLEVYSKEKRTLIRDYDLIFQKSLQLFYSKEFYKARNLFHEVLKRNTEDEIAKWYFLRCEEFLNNPAPTPVFGLFQDEI